mmetsp:Transcript_22738/g.69538  ORF Transcript_22738/g.69538 Transcript_22738/m.69538 type:complete len:99 (+) Transcript_22738:190-486(+)
MMGQWQFSRRAGDLIHFAFTFTSHGAHEANVVLLLRLQWMHQCLAVAGLHGDVCSNCAIGLTLITGSPAEIQGVETAEEDLHEAQVWNRVALVQGTSP